MDKSDLNAQSKRFIELINKMRQLFGTVIVGNLDIFEYILKALFAEGHILIEGLPGLGKTLMVKTISRIMNLKFSRIQFTPDLMPADIIGVNIIVEEKRGQRAFRFEKGPVFTNILLADEINRATPKTQSALLQVMEERFITVFGHDYKIDSPFLTLATQNPIELRGTYPLPEAQLDRFMFKLIINYPDLAQLNSIARLNIDTMGNPPLPSPVINHQEIDSIKEFIGQIPVPEDIYNFATKLVFNTHPENKKSSEIAKKYIKYGSSPRGLISLLAAARISAFLDGRFNLSFEDLEDNFLACLRHRIILNFEAQIQKINTDMILMDIFKNMGRPH